MQHVQIKSCEARISDPKEGNDWEISFGQKCIMYTNNNTLSHLPTAKLGATEQCWSAELSAFDYTIRYTSGHGNKNADTLLRQYATFYSVFSSVGPRDCAPSALVSIHLHEANDSGNLNIYLCSAILLS